VKYALVTPAALVGAAAGAAGAGHARRLRVAQAADGRAANAFESALRGVLIEAGITSFVPQFTIQAGPLLLHADLADPLAGVALEADSFEFHGNRGDFRRDCERYDELVAAGWTVLRLPWELVMFQSETVVRLVRAAMTSGRTASSERTVPT
jgi:very-short-patch-repair endonuclease